MEKHLVLISLARLKIAWPRLNLVRKSKNIRKILAFHEAEKRMDKVRLALDERIHLNNLK